MSAKVFSFKAEVLSDDDIDMIAERVVGKILQHIPSLAKGPEEDKSDEIIKMSDVCKLLQISDTTVRSWMAKGSIPFHRKGKRLYFFKSEVLNSLEQPLRRRA